MIFRIFSILVAILNLKNVIAQNYHLQNVYSKDTQDPFDYNSPIYQDTYYNYNIVKQAEMTSIPGVIIIGPCIINVNWDCPDPNINFFLYTNKHHTVPEPIHVGDEPFDSNVTSSAFQNNLPTKVIIHGYNSDMNLSALIEIKNQYLQNGSYNIFAVDWSKLSPAPCYPSAVINSRHVGRCVSQLIQRLHELDAYDLHVIGFSLGAHVAGFAANHLKPYKLPRITGLDPAMPLFTFVPNDSKLDETDAEFVDVFHTNAFIQGQITRSGHVDFYMNGGVIQPGCWAENRFFACNHHRAPIYFAESINSPKGFWGWPCSSYFMYLIGLCPPKDPQILAGEHVDKISRGMYLVITDSVAPFAVGKYTGPLIEIYKRPMLNITKKKDNIVQFFNKFMNNLMQNCDDVMTLEN